MSEAPPRAILYVEDEPDIQTVAVLALQSLGGFEVEACSSGEEALEKGPAFGPDLILMDVMMPGMDGLSALESLREKPELADTPVIFMTAKVLPSEIEQYKKRGALDVIAKPFDPARLPDMIRSIWNSRAIQDRGATPHDRDV